MKICLDKSLNIGVAVSGGADSMVLLDLLLCTGAKVSVINVDHSIRGKDSAQDSAFVKTYCESRGLPFFFKKVDALTYAKQEGISCELAARELRYAFFDQLLKENKIKVIALAHHLDDQAETLLMRFFRGAGIRGLRGITDREGYIHPLLDYSKEEIVAYAAQNNIPYVQDETNTDTCYRRNFIRNELMPLIKTRYPDLPKVLRKNGLIFCELEDYIASELTPCQIDQTGGSLPISVLDRHPAIAKKSIAEALRAMGILKDIEYTHLQSILGLKDAPNNARINLPYGMDAVKEYTSLRFVYRTEPAAPYEKPFISEGTYKYCGTVYAFQKGETIIKGHSFDACKLPKDAVVRTRRDGDKFRRYKGGEKSLSDYLTDIKVPAAQRDRLLVLAKHSTVYAILGIEIADSVKVDSNTKEILNIVTYQGED